MYTRDGVRTKYIDFFLQTYRNTSIFRLFKNSVMIIILNHTMLCVLDTSVAATVPNKRVFDSNAIIS